MAKDEATPVAAYRARVSEIRALALAEIQTGSTGMDAAACRQELQDIQRRPYSVEWLEATVMTSVISRSKPARLFGYFNKLRNRMAKHGKADEFAAFEEMVRDYLAPLKITNHGYKEFLFEDCDHAPIWQHVDGQIQTLRAAGYEVFLNSGTLLGVIRDNKLIDHDDDIDLAVMLKARNANDAADEWKALKHDLERMGLLHKAPARLPAIYKLHPAGEIEIDLFPAWIDDGKAFVYPHTFGELSEQDVLPLEICGLTGQPLPAMPEKMLATNYGPGWAVPDPLFKFPWADAARRFAPFLERIAS